MPHFESPFSIIFIIVIIIVLVFAIISFLLNVIRITLILSNVKTKSIIKFYCRIGYHWKVEQEYFEGNIIKTKCSACKKEGINLDRHLN